MKKRLLFLTLFVCVLLAFGSASVFAEEFTFGTAEINALGMENSYSDSFVDSDDSLTVSSEISSVTPSAAFYDVNSAHWAFPYISFMVETGVMSGTGNGYFSPDVPMTRAQVAQVIYNMNGRPSMSYQGTFYDVSYGAWYTPAVEWAAVNGIVNGVGNGKYNPDAYISRQDFLTVLYRYCGKVGYGTSESFKLDAFADKYSVASYASSAFGWGVACGIISGNPVDGNLYLQPQNSATRAQISKMMTVFLKQYVYVPYSMVVGDQVSLLSEVLPGDIYKRMTWSSMNNSIATVSSSGVVRGVSAGKTAIYGKLNGGTAVTLTVNVTQTPYEAVALFLKNEGAMSYDSGSTVYKYNISENISGNLFNYGMKYIIASNGSHQIQFYVQEIGSSAEYTAFLKMLPNSNTCQVYIDYYIYRTVTAQAGGSIYPSSYSKSSSLSLNTFSVSNSSYNSNENKAYLGQLLKSAVDRSLEIANDMYFYGNTGVTVKDLGFYNF